MVGQSGSQYLADYYNSMKINERVGYVQPQQENTYRSPADLLQQQLQATISTNENLLSSQHPLQ